MQSCMVHETIGNAAASIVSVGGRTEMQAITQWFFDDRQDVVRTYIGSNLTVPRNGSSNRPLRLAGITMQRTQYTGGYWFCHPSSQHCLPFVRCTRWKRR